MKKEKKQMKNYIMLGSIIFIFGILATLAVTYSFPIMANSTITKIEKNVTITDTGIAESVDKVYDSVVVVSNYKNDALYASGSGFIYEIDDNNMYIITNYHVINNGESFKVTYTDGTSVEAEALGGEEYSDIAVLKVKVKEGLSKVSVSKSSDLKVGDTTFTVGAPLDNVYSWTVTRGIISGKERLVEISTSQSRTSDYIMRVLQTDAAVNSGNSGGPLCNANGEVVGVISAKISSTGVEGMGFAIPIEDAIEKAQQIIKKENSSYPYLGVSMLNVSDIKMYPNYYNYLEKSKLTSGVIIADVEDNMAADKAGLKSGDIITKINDTEIENIAYLRYALYKYKIGDTISITYERNGKTNTIKVTLTSNKNYV